VTFPWPHGDPRAVVKAILSDRRYHTAPRAAAPKSWWDLLWDAIHKWWDDLTAPLGHLLGNGAVTNVVGILVLALITGFLGYVAYRFVRPYLRSFGAVRDRANAATPVHEGDAAALRALALAAAAQGRYHDAAGLLWSSVLRALDETGRVRYDASRTPGEWRRAVRDPAFDAFARDAVVALFGDRGADEALVARMDRTYDAIVIPA
jgi:hypothetical protein